MNRALMIYRLEQFQTLTARQQDIARRYVEPGATTETVAEALYVSRETIRNHLNVIYKKLGLTTSKRKAKDLGYIIGYVDGIGTHRLLMVTSREAA